jgi:hypothetical protein
VLAEKRRIAALNLAVNAYAEINPTPQQIAIVIGAMQRIAETRVGLVVTTPSAQIANPASRAMCATTVSGTPEKFTQALSINAALYVAKDGKLGTCKSMTQIETAAAIDCQQSNPCAARQGLPPPFVQIRHELVHV